MSAAERVALEIGSHRLSLSNLDKVLWPRDGYTKGDLIEYYRAVASALLAHVVNRPITRERFPNGIDAASFFEKNLGKGTPDWLPRVAIPDPDGGRTITYALCNDEATLIYLANLAAIILHAWTSRLPTLDEPDFVFFDLDPGERCTLKTLAVVALHLRDALGEIGLRPLVKTSGGMGLHLFVPLAAGYSYDSVKLFAELVARRAAAELGDAVALERMVKKRDPSAVYLDYVQVGRGKTFVVAYSARARDGAPVSTPLDWSEVEAFARKRGAIVPADEFARFTIRTTPKRLRAEGDLWGGKSWKKQRLEPAIARAQRLWT